MQTKDDKNLEIKDEVAVESDLRISPSDGVISTVVGHSEEYIKSTKTSWLESNASTSKYLSKALFLVFLIFIAAIFCVKISLKLFITSFFDQTSSEQSNFVPEKGTIES